MASNLPVISGEASLSRYLEEINAYPVLEKEEEYNLAKQWIEQGDVSAAHRLVTSHLRLVAKIAMTYRGYGLPVSDLIAEGNIGMMQAVKRFDPDKGFRLSTYALWWIKAAIQEYVLRSWSLVKVGSSATQKRLFFNLRRIKNKLQALSGSSSSTLSQEHVEQIARDLDVSAEEVVAMDTRLSVHDHALDAPVNREDGGVAWVDMLPSTEESHEIVLAEGQEQRQRRALLAGAMKELNEREQQILVKRRLQEPPATLEDLSQEFSISRERVRQIETRAMEKLQAFVAKAMLPSVAVGTA